MEYNLDFYNKWTSIPWIKDNTIFLSLYGSHAYGTNTPASDVDIRGIAVPPKQYYYGFVNNFNQAIIGDPKKKAGKPGAEATDDEIEKSDVVIFDIRKFVKLAQNCNPNVLELLFIDPNDYIKTTPYYEKLVKHRDKFLSKRVRYSYQGYAFGQMKRIKLHHNYLLNPPTHKPTRKEFGLPEHTVIPIEQLEATNAMIKKKIDSWNVDLGFLDRDKRLEIEENITNILADIGSASIYLNNKALWKEAAASAGINTNFILLIQKEKEYEQKAKEWKKYQEWKQNRNEARAELEVKYGYDSKHAMHLVRLSRQCEELLRYGTLEVKRKDADDLLEIRHGKWTYDQLMDWFDRQNKIIDELYESSTALPYENDAKFLDGLCMEIVEEFLSKS